jgi:hypothetical protein
VSRRLFAPGATMLRRKVPWTRQRVPNAVSWIVFATTSILPATLRMMPRQTRLKKKELRRLISVPLWWAHFFFLAAHLFLCAAAILARPSALIVLRFPRLSGAVWPASSARTFSRRLISASMVCMISSVFMARV